MDAAVKNRRNSSVGKSGTALTLALLIGIVLVNLILPMLTLMAKSVDFDPFYSGFVNTLSSAATKRALANSIKVTLVSSTIATTMAFFFAYVVEFKLSPRWRQVFRFWSILPMLVPSITHGIVIVYLFGRMGIFTRLLGIQLPIYGPLGIVMGSFFYAFPTAFLVLSQALTNLDGRLFESSIILGAGPFRRFVDVVLPIMKYSIFSAFSVCFTMIFTDYGIPLSVGGTYSILPILFYKNVIGLLDFSRGAIFSTILLVPAVMVYVLDVFYFSKKQPHLGHNIRPVDSGRFHPVQRTGFLALTCVITIPIVIILIAPFITAWPYDLALTLRHFERIISVGALSRLVRNSVFIAFMTGVLGTAVAFFSGYIYVRDKNGYSTLKKINHGLYMITLAVPGLALGLAFALFFKGTFLYNTLALMIIVNVVHFYGSPYMMVISHFKLLNPNLEDICTTLGGNKFNMIVDVIIPNSKKMLLDVFVYFFTNTMITISAISLLYNSRNMTLALQITAYNDQGTWESAIAVSLVILIINVILKMWQTLRLDKRRQKMVPVQNPS